MTDSKMELLRNWYTRIRIAQAAHYQDADNLRRKNLMLGLPVVLLSTIVGTSVFASLAEENPSITIRIALGVVSILAAALASLQTFLNYSEQSAKHLDAATKLSSLKKEIEENMVLLKDHVSEIDEFIRSVRTKWDTITKESPLLSERSFQRNFRKYGGAGAFPYGQPIGDTAIDRDNRC